MSTSGGEALHRHAEPPLESDRIAEARTKHGDASRHRGPGRQSLVTFLFAAPMLLLATGASVWTCVAAIFISGITNDVLGVLWQTTIRTHVPAEALSRVSAYDTFGFLAIAPLGLAAARPLAATMGIPATLAACALLVIAATGTALLAPHVLNLRVPQPG